METIRTKIRMSTIGKAVIAFAVLIFICCAAVWGLGVGGEAFAEGNDESTGTITFSASSFTTSISSVIDPMAHPEVDAATKSQFKFLSAFSGDSGEFEVNAMTVPMNDAGWLDDFLNYTFLLNVVMSGTATSTNDDGSVSYPTQYTLSLKMRAKDSAIASYILGGGISAEYAVLDDATVSGTTLSGKTFSGSIYNINEVGVYKISSVKVKFNANTDLALALELDGFSNSGSAIKSSDAGDSFSTSSADDVTGVKVSSISFVMQTVIYINTNGIGKDINLGIESNNRQYGEQSDFKDLVKLHIDKGETVKSGEAFTYSSSTDEVYDVSTTDKRFFKVMYDGAFEGYSPTFGPGATAANGVNLKGISDKLMINWYNNTISKDTYCDGAVTKAGNYYLTIEPKLTYGYDNIGGTDTARLGATNTFGPEYQLVEVREVGLNVQYTQPFEIAKRKLNVLIASEQLYNESGKGTIYYRSSREYNESDDASDMLVNTNFVKKNEGESDESVYQRRLDFWVNEMNGVGADFEAIESGAGGRYISEGSLFTFVDSVFDDFNVGTRKSVNVKMAFRSMSITDGSAYYISEVYELNLLMLPDKKAVGQAMGYQGVLNGLFEIAPNSMELRFANGSPSDGEGKEKFENVITYGDRLYADRGDSGSSDRDGYDFNKYLVMSAVTTDVVDGKSFLCPEYRNDWRIIYQDGCFENLKDKLSKDYNYIYVVVKLGQKPEEGDQFFDYTDADGNNYVRHNQQMYAGQYYFYYEIYVVYKTDPMGEGNKLTAKNGVFNIYASTQSDAACLFTIKPTLQGLTVNQKVLTVTIHSCQLEKDYDGTDEIKDFDASVSGIIAADTEFVKFVSSAHYMYAGASKEVNIIYNYSLEAANPALAGLVAKILNSYRIDENNINSEIGSNYNIGAIRHLKLQVNFIEGAYDYSRKYDTEMYVAVRVGRRGIDVDKDGNTLTEDYYYIRRRNVSGAKNGLYLAESELNEEYIFNGCTYVKLELSGFLEGEGFAWNTAQYPVNDFMYSKKVSDPLLYAKGWLDTDQLLTWRDTTPERGGVEINLKTPSSSNPNDKYRLELNTFDFTNYTIQPLANEYGWLLIEKLDVKPTHIEISSVEATDYVYSGLGYGSVLFSEEKGQIKYSKHPGAAELKADPEKLKLKVLKYETDCTEKGAGHNHIFDTADPSIANMVYAGKYRMLLTVGETTNYNSYTVEFDARIKPRSVDVYVTCPFRVYDDPQLEYNDYAYIDSEEDLTSALLNYKTGDISTKPDFAGSSVYLYGVTLEANTTYVYGSEEYNRVLGGRRNYVLYVGLVPGETIDTSTGDRAAQVQIQYSNFIDEAKIHANAVTAIGAVKHNYTFREIPSHLFVKPRPLTLTIDNLSQRKNYTGSDIEPDAEISDGTGKAEVPGVLEMYIIGYKDEEYSDDTNIHAIETGQYRLKVRAKPDFSKGDRAANYEASREWIDVDLEIVPTRLELIENSNILKVMFDDSIIDIGLFNSYFRGINEFASDGEKNTIYAVSDWGKIEILSCLKDGEALEKKDGKYEIKAAGKYDISVQATILKYNGYNELNVYFGEEKSDNFTFDIELTVEKSSKLDFTILRSQDVSVTKNIVQADDEGLLFKGAFQMTYKCAEENFAYSLIFGGQDYSDSDKISVVGSVDGYLYSINQKIYGQNGADDVLSDGIYRLTGIDYDFASRPKMLEARKYILRYVLNSAEDESTYDPNFVTRQYEIEFTVIPAQLYVTIVFDSAHGANKIYRESNSYIENNFVSFAYEGWASEADVAEMVQNPTVNWSDVPELIDGDEASYDAPAGSHYRIWTQGGEAPKNYVLNHSRSDCQFEVKRATAQAVVYGYYDEATGVYEPSRVYLGKAKEPEVSRLTVGKDGKPERVDDEKEPIGDAGVTITFMGMFIGNDKLNITDADIAPCDSFKDVGKYVFAVSVIASQNYDAIPEKYYYFEVTKAELTANFVKITDPINMTYELSRGYSSKIYDGLQANYPQFFIAYTGFVGEDDEIDMYKNPQRISYGASVGGVAGLELIHPYYYIVEDESRIEPTHIGLYDIVAEGGESKNYEIKVSYAEEGKPQMEIAKRQIDIKATTKVQKTYDATNKIPVGAVTSKNYSYSKVKDELGQEIAESGLVAGDEVNLSFNLADSFFERIDVHDETGLASVVAVRIYGYSIDNENYELKISGLKVDKDGQFYFELLGNINAAQAEIIFTQDDGTVITNTVSVVYDGEPHGVVAIVRGVRVPNVSDEQYEPVDSILTYDSEDFNEPISDRPTNAGTYTVVLEVTSGGNYMATKRQITMIIEQAEVEITFGGDIVQTYGSIIDALSAKATGVGGYERTNLPITYYDNNDNPVIDIKKANAGSYKAVAVFEGDINFKRNEKAELFTIKRRGMNVIINISASYEYNGKSVENDIYFEFNGERYYPTLKYNRIVNGVPVPFNYGENAAEGYPKNVGEYQVSTDDSFDNFEILDKYWTSFSITPVTLRVIINDKTVTAGEDYGVGYRLEGLVSGDSENNALSEKPVWEYYDANGNKLSEAPNNAGIYRVVPKGASANNYLISYVYGMLKLNKAQLSQQVNESTGSVNDIILEGSFAADATLVVRQADTLQYNQYSTLLSAYSTVDSTIADYGIAELYNMRLGDGSVTSDINGEMSVKILCPSYFAKFSAETSEFYVAQISADGTVKLLTARREGDYLVFNTDSLETFALLAGYDTLNKGTNLDWMLYVGIAVCIILVGVALLIVKKKE